ncbi:MAG TPA: cytochrome b/b6 domain-containing protein [Devosia sp.]|jgi:cytochrome b561|uniref:cytochrome b n=1 Tax=Devosia sp. TaxID=1871048 RepID=UPI002DDCF1AE|nr:cytochrome b/b6 domain-containing protein [Devosia sp.]HEV2514205.1 cytochrome b/b6 domain-containing protein [Devosia sp.]
MADRVAPKGYSLAQIVLHWTIAALVVVQLLVNEDIQDAFKDRTDGEPFEGETGALVHITVGLTILGLAALRLIIRFTRGVPEPHDTNPVVVNWLGHGAHVLLYAFLLAMPLTGAIAWFTGIELSAELHELGRLILIPLILLHALGALAEHYVFRTNSLARILKSEPPQT